MGCDGQLKALDAMIVNKCIEASIRANNYTFTYTKNCNEWSFNHPRFWQYEKFFSLKYILEVRKRKEIHLLIIIIFYKVCKLHITYI
jgi:hypothetical protein